MLMLPHAALSGGGGTPGKKRLGSGGGGGGAKGTEMKDLLHPGPNGMEPHPDDFVPRLGPAEGGDLWAFGRGHAALHHVINSAPGGDANAVVSMLDAFSSMHDLPFGLSEPRGSVLDSVMQQAIGPPPGLRGAGSAQEDDGDASFSGMNVLVIGSGFGGRTLRCLPPLIQFVTSSGSDGFEHNVVSLERDAHLSAQGQQLVGHAIGEELQDRVRHVPFMPGPDTTLDESLESLREGWEIPSFNVVLLDDSEGRDGQQDQLKSLVSAGALRPGAVVHAEGPAADSPDTVRFLSSLELHSAGGGDDGADSTGPRIHFETQVHDIGDGRSAVVAVASKKHDEL